jgi:phage-related protein
LHQSPEEEQSLPESIEREITALQSGGDPLPPPLRTDMEARFGMDLGSIRLHTDPRAIRLNETLYAQAFTIGEHIAFNRGYYQPETAAGRFLLAHELAHVAQQRGETGSVEQQPVRRGFWSDLYHGAVDILGDIADWAVDKIREFGWRLLETISPEFARTVRAIVDEGILTWLGRQVARAWDGFIGTLRALVPFDGPRQLIDFFAGLVERAAAIASGLASGRCEPLMAAINDMKTFVVETAGVAWNKLTEFLQPVGDFFRDLWANFGAPAVQWLREFGGAVWEGIQDLGRRFWEWIRPVREAAARVWNWFKDLLFGSSEGEDSTGSQGGVLGWISRKAGEAWDWVKAQTRPVWQPVAEFAGRVAELIPPAFVREMGEQAQQLSSELDTAASGMDGGEGVPVARDTLASVLPSVQHIIATVRRIIVGAGQWLGERITGVGALVTGLIGRLRASDLLSWLAGAFTWLEEGVTSLLAWARDKVAVLFAWLVQGFDALTPFLELVLDTVRKVITIFGDLLQLPLLVLNSIWQRVPRCIREPVENFIKNQILARIPVFGQFFSDPELWPRVQQTALGILRRIFVDGDLAGAAWAFFQAVLGILGVPAQLVVQILAKAAGAIGAILTDPLGFLANLLRAMGAGFTRFFDNIGTHLLSGFTSWLFVTVREAGINPPADFSLRSVLGFVLEVLGLTRDTIFARLERRIDPAIVARLRSMLEIATGVWSFVATLINDGPAGLWREVSERLSNLWDTVVQGVTGFITERVIGWASRWLLSLLDVTGIMPVINTLIAIYRAIESFMQYLRQMLEIVSRVLDGIGGIARGAIGEAAGFVESALAGALPIAIGFLANQAGLGRLSQRLREILSGLRERVTGAVDWLIDRALRLGRAVLDMVRRGVSRVREWWRQRFGFRGTDGTSHALYLSGENPDTELMVASAPMTYRAFLASIPTTTANRDAKTRAETLYGEFTRTQRLAARERRQGTAAATASGESDVHSATLVDQVQRLAEATAALMPAEANQSTTPRFSSVTGQGYGQRVQIERLTSERNHWPVRGGEPSARSPRWNRLNQRATDGHASDYLYIRGHLLNHNLDGPGNMWENLAPITQTANNRGGRSMLHAFENPVKNTVDERGPGGSQGQVANFDVQANYTGASRSSDLSAIEGELIKPTPVRPVDELRKIREIVTEEQFVPDSVTCSADLIHADGRRQELRNIVVPNTITTDWRDYTLVNR